MKKYILFIAALFSMSLFAQEDSQWRGSNRDGIYNQTGLLKQWPANGPQLLWKYEGLGAGHTSVAIANNKIYITGLQEEKVVLYVFNLKGELITKKVVVDEWKESYQGPRSTVCVNDGKLYLFTALGQLLCLDEASLKEVWTKNIFKDFDGENIRWGVTESPLIVGDVIYITPGGKKDNIVALNKKTGALIWSSPGEGTSTAYCSPQYISDQSVPIIVTSTADFIIGLNAKTGAKLWSFPQKNRYNIHPNTPLYYKGMLLSVTGYGEGSVMLRLKDGGKGVEQVWKVKEMDSRTGGVVRVGDNIFSSGDANKFWFCVDWNTGAIKYKSNEITQGNVIYADGMLYCYSEKGEMALVKADPAKFDLVSQFKITLGTEQHWAHPVIHNGVLYVRHGDALMAYKIQK